MFYSHELASIHVLHRLRFTLHTANFMPYPNFIRFTSCSVAGCVLIIFSQDKNCVVCSRLYLRNASQSSNGGREREGVKECAGNRSEPNQVSWQISRQAEERGKDSEDVKTEEELEISRRLQACVCSVQGPLLVTRLHTLSRQKCSPRCVSAMDVRINTCQHQANKSGKQQMHRVSVAIHKIDETSRRRLRVCV